MKILIFAGFLLIQAISAKFGIAEKLESRLTNGRDARVGEFPHQALLQVALQGFVYFPVCGGTIIDEYHVLTAGHCVNGIVGMFGKYRIKAGKYQLFSDNENVQTIRVVKTIPYEKFPTHIGNQQDIAILKLESPLVFNDFVKSVKLPEKNTISTGEAVLSGWGSISKQKFPRFPKTLQTATVPIIENKVCGEAVKKLTKNLELRASHLCTGPLGGSTSACYGDSGGPLVQYVNNSTELVGLISWGFNPCGTKGSPTIYTRVSYYIDWIQQNISDN